jgi:hypothetical protein
MITSYRITGEDWELLEAAMKQDDHSGLSYPLFYYEPGTVCNVWQYNGSPVLFCRGKVLEDQTSVWLNVQFVNNKDKRKNAIVINAMVTDLIYKLGHEGFKDLQFKSDASALVDFCKKKFGFVEIDGILHKKLEA